jgi:hypothetical protein
VDWWRSLTLEVVDVISIGAATELVLRKKRSLI